MLDILRFALVALSFKYRKVTNYYFIYELISLAVRLMVNGNGIDLIKAGIINFFIPLMNLSYSQSFWKDLVATMLISPFHKLFVLPIINEEGSPNYSQLGHELVISLLGFLNCYCIISSIGYLISKTELERIGNENLLN